MVAERHKAGDVNTVRPGNAAAEPRAKPELQALSTPAHPLPDEEDTDRGPTALARPQQLVGRYRLLMPLAEGGMAQVWAAKPEKGGLSRTVVLKLVLPKFAADEHYARMFIDEAMIASAVHHPNACEIFELGKHEDLLFMVLEWVPGDTLNSLVRASREPIGDGVAVRIIADACAGLHAAHEALGPDGLPLGIVHRDISPQNILVSIHGHAKVSDFGIAKARHQLHARTQTGEIKGKFAYIAPEQIRGAQVDRRADIYSMGCLLYVATTGQRPFGAGASALGKIVQGKYALPSTLREDYPPELERIIRTALSSSPDERFNTAEEMRFALEQWLFTLERPVTHAQVAALVASRLTPEKRGVIDVLMTTARVLPEALAFRLLPELELTQTPTAKVKPSSPVNARMRVPTPMPVPTAAAAAAPASAPASTRVASAPEQVTGSRTFTIPQFRSRNTPWLVLTVGLLVIALLLFLLGR
jgi:eukaryotic-like serine/threonine-protein kinase